MKREDRIKKLRKTKWIIIGICLLIIVLVFGLILSQKITSNSEKNSNSNIAENFTEASTQEIKTVTETTTETTTETVTEEVTTTEEIVNTDYVADLEVAKNTDQIVVVMGTGGSSGTLSYHTKDSSGIWTEEFEISADVGKNGITSSKKEGDGKTPSGCYDFIVAFGIEDNPGSIMEYRKVTNNSYWVDDGNSPYYNQWVDASVTEGSFSSEHLIDHNPSYLYALNIGYNTNCVPGLGSAIFLHCKSGSGKTAGCVAIDKDYMKELITKVDAQTKIIIVESKEELENY